MKTPAPEKTARILRSTRKTAGLTQQVFANQLGISQSNLSKLESARLLPTLETWYNLCEEFNVPFESGMDGFIDRLPVASAEARLNDDGFVMPDEFSRHRRSSVRAIKPLLIFLQDHLSPEKYDEYFENLKLDPDFFVDLNHWTNIQFGYDFFANTLQRKLITPREIGKISEHVATKNIQGLFHAQFEKCANTEDLFKHLIKNMKFYETNFSYSVADVSKNHLDFSAIPEPHLKEFKVSEQLGDVVCKYKSSYIAHFAKYSAQQVRELSHDECYYRGDERCLYRLKVN